MLMYTITYDELSKRLIKIMLSGHYKTNEALLFPSSRELHRFKSAFYWHLDQVPKWLLPDVTKNNQSYFSYEYGNFIFALKGHTLMGRTINSLYIHEDVPEKEFKETVFRILPTMQVKDSLYRFREKFGDCTNE